MTLTETPFDARPEQRGADIVVKREELTYEFGNGNSFFGDMFRAQVQFDFAAQERLVRHQREYDLETTKRRRKEAKRLAAREDELAANGESIELRINPNTTLGTGGEFSPPLWLEAKFSAAAAAGRVLADLVGSIVLPPGVASVNIPRIATGAVAAIQPGQAGIVPSQDETTFNANSNVVTITGDVDASMQLFEQTPNGYDIVAFTDMGKNYCKNLDAQLFNGSNANGQLMGLTQVTLPSGHSIDGSGFNAISTLWPGFGKAYAAVGNDRQLPPERWLIAPRRWAWIASSVDSSLRPIGSPGTAAPALSDYPLAGNTAPAGSIFGKPAYEAGAIPAGSSADFAVCCRPSDLLLFESTPKFAVDQVVLSGQLQVRMQLRRYVAWVPQRYPSSIAIVTAIPQPSGF